MSAPESQRPICPSPHLYRARNLVERRYYIVNYYNNSIAGTDVDPEKLGRELGVLKAYEEVVD